MPGCERLHGSALSEDGNPSCELSAEQRGGIGLTERAQSGDPRQEADRHGEASHASHEPGREQHFHVHRPGDVGQDHGQGEGQGEPPRVTQTDWPRTSRRSRQRGMPRARRTAYSRRAATVAP